MATLALAETEKVKVLYHVDGHDSGHSEVCDGVN